MSRLPDFFIIGAAKAGTTSVHAALSRHPAIFMPDRKEPEFLARDDLYDQGIESYAQLFEPSQPGQLIGEASTLYSLGRFFPHTARRMAAHCPDAKIVYIVREPVDRAYSYYLQLTKNYQNWSGDNAFHRTFEDFVLPDRHARAAPRAKAFAGFDAHLPDSPDLCLDGSRYHSQLQRYLEVFPRERICILRFEDFKADRAGFFARLTDFLGVDRLDETVLAGAATRKNVSEDFFRRQADLRKLDALKRKSGAVWQARKLLPESVRALARRAVLGVSPARAADVQPPEVEQATRDALARAFRAEDEALGKLTGIRYY